SKDESFYRNAMHKLPSRWEEVISNDGNYIVNVSQMYYFLLIRKQTELSGRPNIIKKKEKLKSLHLPKR
ncbi:hypothetical protein WH47_00906, partial [Habropoda laboriosa]